MAKKYYWLKLNEGFFDDKIIKKLRRLAGGDTYVIIYLKMQLLSIKTEGKLFFEGVEGSFEEELALDIDEEVENVKVTVTYLEKLNLLESSIADEYILPSVLELIGSESESAERVRRYRENKDKKLLQCNDDVTECNENVISCNTEKEKEIEIDIDNKKHISAFFEQVWNLYPNKKGKGQISDSKKKILCKIGKDELSRAIERYKTELQKDDWRKPQNGSTFFNSGYVDYLDANYSPSEVKLSKAQCQQQKPNKFNQFPQRQYTDQEYAELEKKLLSKSIN
jgi:predicted phage replisome organizer